VLRELRTGRDGYPYAICDSDGRRIVAAVNGNLERYLGQGIKIVYSRIDANGALREARVDPSGSLQVAPPAR
jgi:hypothetical protein